ncbi:DUF4251 domain-containing protein [Sinomicrobium weinanense]|uniref:DUF4251 domain-containing protein n=1 Tax=Sinomicrobium weinanense TaxID=2842200 RepID=A0A926JVG8_9FLAO|nr:DUF4251 domain-containing protein [Sinomicrobium weinanense]MBC9797943.1 DUF4251 domain-containing protein [Sinomicrobium weinanense]MBU3123265.1 DUF4251 domain-containing protein [Sinomicrobium weinanense]
MKHLHYFSGLILLAVFCSCSGAKNAVSGAQDMGALDTLIQQKKFRVVNDWANPMVTTAMMNVIGLLGPQHNAQRINLIGNSNYFEMKGDSVKAYLPYFGERQMGGGYNTDGEAIQFDQEATDMDIKYVKAKELYRMTFKARKDSESFNVVLEVYGNKKTVLMVNSSQRNPIRYEGTIAALKEE